MRVLLTIKVGLLIEERAWSNTSEDEAFDGRDEHQGLPDM